MQDAGWPIGATTFEVRVTEVDGVVDIDTYGFREPAKLAATLHDFHVDNDFPGHAHVAAYSHYQLADEAPEASSVRLELLDPVLNNLPTVYGETATGVLHSNQLLHEFDFNERYTEYTAVLCGADDHGADPTPTNRREHEQRPMYADVSDGELVLLEVLAGDDQNPEDPAADGGARDQAFGWSRNAGYFSIDAARPRSEFLSDLGRCALFHYFGHANSHLIQYYTEGEKIWGDELWLNGTTLVPMPRMRLAVLWGCLTADVAQDPVPIAERFVRCGATCAVGWTACLATEHEIVFAGEFGHRAYGIGLPVSESVPGAALAAHSAFPFDTGILNAECLGQSEITVKEPLYQ